MYKASPNWTNSYNNSPGVGAFFYVGYDVITLGVMELFMTPLEAGGKVYRAAKGTTYEVTVTYDTGGRVVDVSWKIAGSQGGAKDRN